jgi:hypothetical protein
MGQSPELFPGDQERAVPDACVNLLFNQIDLAVAGVTALRKEATTARSSRPMQAATMR